MRRIYSLSVIFAALFLAACASKVKEEATVDIKPETVLAEKTKTCPPPAKYANTVTDREEAEGWVNLFNGDTIAHWKNFGRDGVEGWVIEDGLLVALGEGGDHGNDIITKEQYGNFELCVEWNISAGGNSGIFYHVVEEGQEMIYATGPEYQLLDDFDERWKDLSKKQTSGANYAMQAPDSLKVLKPAGEWNYTYIRVQDSLVEHWLNEKLVCEYVLWSEEWKSQIQDSKWKNYPDYGLAKKGHIGLQDHGGVTKFRNIKVRSLD